MSLIHINSIFLVMVNHCYLFMFCILATVIHAVPSWSPLKWRLTGYDIFRLPVYVCMAPDRRLHHNPDWKLCCRLWPNPEWENIIFCEGLQKRGRFFSVYILLKTRMARSSCRVTCLMPKVLAPFWPRLAALDVSDNSKICFFLSFY